VEVMVEQYDFFRGFANIKNQRCLSGQL
jgi:hypothetical protein